MRPKFFSSSSKVIQCSASGKMGVILVLMNSLVEKLWFVPESACFGKQLAGNIGDCSRKNRFEDNRAAISEVVPGNTCLGNNRAEMS